VSLPVTGLPPVDPRGGRRHRHHNDVAWPGAPLRAGAGRRVARVVRRAGSGGRAGPLGPQEPAVGQRGRGMCCSTGLHRSQNGCFTMNGFRIPNLKKCPLEKCYVTEVPIISYAKFTDLPSKPLPPIRRSSRSLIFFSADSHLTRQRVLAPHAPSPVHPNRLPARRIPSAPPMAYLWGDAPQRSEGRRPPPRQSAISAPTAHAMGPTTALLLPDTLSPPGKLSSVPVRPTLSGYNFSLLFLTQVLFRRCSHPKGVVSGNGTIPSSRQGAL